MHSAFLKHCFPTVDPCKLEGYTIVAKHGWQTHSEYYEEIIIEKKDLYYIVSHGYCVMSNDNINPFTIKVFISSSFRSRI